MTVTLSLAAFFATFFPMLAAGIGLGIWAARKPRRAPMPDLPRKATRLEVDLKKTLDGSVQISELAEQCKRKEI